MHLFTFRHVLIFVIVTVLAGCSHFPSYSSSLSQKIGHNNLYPSPLYDYWGNKIEIWQKRELDVAAAPKSNSTKLREQYFRFRAERRRSLVQELTEWIQKQSSEFYFMDGPVDHWPTFEEMLTYNGDDCDGLDILVFNLLHDLGFRKGEVYRAIIYRPSDWQHHMVTLWYETAGDDDPWVIDPTGISGTGMNRSSDITRLDDDDRWIVLRVFDYTDIFEVR